MKLIKKRRKRKANQGNSFIVVVATISFLAVLTTALLVAVALCYRLKAYDINTRDNFYYLEQAMDEIYEGIGSISMKHLNAAYDETAEVLVYYDTDKKTYVSMDNDDANKLMKAAYVSKLKGDSRLEYANIRDTLNDFISNKYDPASVDTSEGVQLSVGNVVWSNDVLTIKDLVLKREAKYSTVNTRKVTDAARPNASTFIQSITTDLTVAVPDITLDFNVDTDISELYDFALISDMGVEVSGIGINSHIIGNVYAAADFYNKEYNSAASNGVVADETEETRTRALNNRVNSYTAEQLEKCDGVSEQSMYSGFYVSGAKVSIMADKLIVPGSIAAMNCASVNIIGGIENGSSSPTKVWADGIVLGGFSRKLGGTNTYSGASMKMNADAYVYDDLEVNAKASSFALTGSYYGYNYATTDNRKFSDEFIAAATKRKYTANVKINDGNYSDGHLTGQSHYNSSAIVINGEESTLDLSKTDRMYIAGQAYVEMSKATTTNTYVAREQDGQLKLDKMTPGEESNDALEKIEKVDKVEYNDYDVKNDDNYTVSGDGTKKRIQDYRTGEGLSLKSNQLAYIPPYRMVVDYDGGLYAVWPEIMTHQDYFKDMWDDLSKIPIIKTVVGGKNYYFYDFSQAKNTVEMNRFIEAYEKLFKKSYEEGYSIGENAFLYNIKEWELFKMNDYVVEERNIYSNSAISVVKEGKVEIVADSKSVQPLLDAKKELKTDALLPDVADVSDGSSPSDKTKYARKVTIGLQNKYKEMKLLLTDSSANGTAVTNAFAMDESKITPINFYFNFEGLNGITKTGGKRGNLQSKRKMATSGYWVYLGEDDVEVAVDPDNPDGMVKGIVMCKGDVTFAPGVKEFEGLIVSGGKIKVDHNVDFVSNAEIVKSILRECDESQGAGLDYSGVCKLFRHFISTYVPQGTTTTDIEPMKSVTAVQYEDILAFKNWKKNVD